MNNEKPIFIINPNANMGQAWRLAADLRPIMEEYGGADWAGSVYPTHAIELTKKAVDEGYDLIIAGGGDGTVHEVVNAIMEYPKEKRPALGVIPLGSGNDFSYAVGMDPDPAKALRQIFTGSESWVDIGKVEDDRGRTEYFDNTIGIGFDAIVTIHSHKMPLVRGFLMYILAVLKTIFLNHHPIGVDVTMDGDKKFQEELLMFTICNGGREGGGFHLYPEAKNGDGVYHYVTVPKVSRLMMLRLLPAFMNGSHLKHPKVKFGDFKDMELESDSAMFIHIDGEVFAGFTSDLRKIKITMEHQAIRVVS
jgi:YegS/Rv2252/BmrU family lipid kinase